MAAYGLNALVENLKTPGRLAERQPFARLELCRRPYEQPKLVRQYARSRLFREPTGDRLDLFAFGAKGADQGWRAV